MKSFTLSAGEERDGVGLIFPINGLFKVAGNVIAKGDSHLVNTGTSELLDPVDKSTLRTGQISMDGSFSFEYVPAGEYLLRVSLAADLDPDAKPQKLGGGLDLLAALPEVGNALRKHLHDYANTDLPISLHGEVTGITIAVSELPGKPSAAALTDAPSAPTVKK